MKKIKGNVFENVYMLKLQYLRLKFKNNLSNYVVDIKAGRDCRKKIQSPPSGQISPFKNLD